MSRCMICKKRFLQNKLGRPRKMCGSSDCFRTYKAAKKREYRNRTDCKACGKTIQKPKRACSARCGKQLETRDKWEAQRTAIAARYPSILRDPYDLLSEPDSHMYNSILDSIADLNITGDCPNPGCDGVILQRRRGPKAKYCAECGGRKAK